MTGFTQFIHDQEAEARAVAGPEAPKQTERHDCTKCGESHWGHELGRDEYGAPTCPSCGKTLCGYGSIVERDQRA